MIKELREKLDSKKISAVELTQQYLARIKKRNPELNAYVLVLEDYALEQAKQADVRIAKGDIQPLTGIPYALKDVFCVDGIETTACSNILKGYIPPYTGTVAKKLYNQGAVLLGKTNTDEFTMGASTENSCFGVTRNPHDITKVAGGSSGGSAAAVAADLAVFALGTDTGGSIRLPAAYCGVAGLRPTYGLVSRYGVISMASSLDTIGPITTTCADAQAVLQEITGIDPLDSTTIASTNVVKQNSKKIELNKITIGVPKEYFSVAGLNETVRQRIEEVIAQLKKQYKITVKEISLPHTQFAIPTYYVLCPCEVSSNMARYDGIKYGYRSEQVEDLFSVYAQSRAEGFGDEVKRRIMLGTYALSAGYYEAYYLKAAKVRTLIKQDFTKAFQEVDVIITPTTPNTAFAVGEKAQDPLEMYLADIYLAAVSLAGLPGLAVPAGQLKQLPIGVQLIGRQFSEDSLLQFGAIIEQLYK
ncbi:MAG: Asp-tRNA(Asn)/Glu-tRNA(Gln) amidotransferase subunit GatA [Patescibacteria group bacterium]|jgi:aspartyl-tRNA(Asn)/glutamyl-tRNA(Gln) amidotransferase subunit A